MVEARLPALPAGAGAAFDEVTRRHGDYALVGVGCVVELDGGGRAQRVRLAACGIADRPVRLKAAEIVIPEKRLQGSLMGSSFFRLDIPLYAQLYMDGRLKLNELISERVPLDGVNAALNQLDSPLVARAVVTF